MTIQVDTQLIERIYVTRGDNLTNGEGIRSDKCYGLQIKGQILWFNDSFARLSELSYKLRPLDLAVTDGGHWGYWADGEATIDKKVTRISQHHDDVFSSGSSYIKKSLQAPHGNYWWRMEQVTEYLSGLTSSCIQSSSYPLLAQ